MLEVEVLIQIQNEILLPILLVPMTLIHALHVTSRHLVSSLDPLLKIPLAIFYRLESSKNFA